MTLLGKGFGLFTGARNPRYLPILGISFVLLVFVLILHGIENSLMRQASVLTFDSMQRLQPRSYEEAPVSIIDIDEASLKQLGQWPWPRTRIAELVDKLTNAGIAVIAFDIVFAEPDRTSPKRLIDVIETNPSAERDYQELRNFVDHDEILAAAIAQAPVVNGIILTGEPSFRAPMAKSGFVFAGELPLDRLPKYRGAINSIGNLEEKASGTGVISVLGDRDRIVRRVQLLSRVGDQIVPSLGLEALRISRGAKSIIIKSAASSGQMSAGNNAITEVKVGDIVIPTTANGEVWIYYTPPVPDRFISAAQVLDASMTIDQLKQKIAGHIVFIGAGAAGLRDVVATPLRPYEVGVTVHANFVEQALQANFLVRPDWSKGFERMMIIVAGIAITVSVFIGGGLWAGIITALIVIGQLIFSWFSFTQNQLLIDPVFPVASAILLYMGLAGYKYFQTEQEKIQVRRAFSQYLSPLMVERIADNPGLLKLGGEQRELTIIFCDIRNFSGLSESLQPEKLTSLLNSFLTPMTEILLSEGATIDKYIGDSIMAFWNAPIDTPIHEQKAINAARLMRERLKGLNTEIDTTFSSLQKEALEIGIGINTGTCCVGNLGSESRFSYSAIGDAVNLSSRFEGLTKQYGVNIIFGTYTKKALSDNDIFELDLIRVVGRQHPERIFTILSESSTEDASKFSDIKTLHNQMLAAYRAQEWDKALSALGELQLEVLIKPDLSIFYELMSSRINEFRITPPPANWDGIYNAEIK